MVAASVLPSPVFISAILPSCSTMPPMIWTSKGRIPSVRLETSLTTAKASGKSSSMVSPPASLSRNSPVLALRSESWSFSIPGSKAETASTRCCRTLTLRPSPILNIFVNKFAKTSYPYLCVLTGLAGRLYEPVVSVTTPVYHIYITRIGAGEHVEVVVEELQLQDRLLSAHRLHLELLGPDDTSLYFLFLLHHEGLHRLIQHLRSILQLTLPAVDLAPPVTLDLPLQLVRHPIDGGVHVLGCLASLEYRPVDKQGGLGHLWLGYRAVPLVDQLHLSTRIAPTLIEKPGDPLHLLRSVALESLGYGNVAPLDEYVHSLLPSTKGFRLRVSSIRSRPQDISISPPARVES